MSSRTKDNLHFVVLGTQTIFKSIPLSTRIMSFIIEKVILPIYKCIIHKQKHIFCSSCQLLLLKVFKLKTSIALLLLEYCPYTSKIHVHYYHNKVVLFLQQSIMWMYQLGVQHWQMQNKAIFSTGELLGRTEDLPDGWKLNKG